MSFLSGVLGLFLTLAGFMGLHTALFDATGAWRPDWSAAVAYAACGGLGALMLWRGFRAPPAG